MLRGHTPKGWRRGWSLCRRKFRTDRYGEQAAYYDYDHPDAVFPEGDENGLCFQRVKAWQSSGRTSGGVSREELGEQSGGTLQAVLWGELALSPYDRVLALGGCYEVKDIQVWPSHRLLLFDRLW